MSQPKKSPTSPNKTETLIQAHLVIRGRVQGVGYRFFAQDTAEHHGLQGWVRNLPNGEVEAQVQGLRPVIELWVEDLKKGPPVARVESVDVDWRPCAAPFSGFEIR